MAFRPPISFDGMADHELGPIRLLHVESIRAHELVVLSLEGELDIAGLEDLTVHVEAAATQPVAHVVIDLRALSFIDGTGVRAIVSAATLIGERVVVYPGPARVQRVFELTGSLRALPFTAPPAPHAIPDERESNLEFVRRLWHAFRTGGADAMVRLVPNEVQWRPSVAGGRVLNGREELRSFWAARPIGAAVRVTEFRAIGEDVLVRCEYPRLNGTLKVVWSLYHFSEMVLRRAETYETEREALAHAA
jgi:anti-anti-sigma factor